MLTLEGHRHLVRSARPPAPPPPRSIKLSSSSASITSENRAGDLFLFTGSRSSWKNYFLQTLHSGLRKSPNLTKHFKTTWYPQKFLCPGFHNLVGQTSNREKPSAKVTPPELGFGRGQLRADADKCF